MCGPKTRVLLALGLILVTSACFRTTAPAAWLSVPEVAQREAYGGWVRVAYQRDTSARTVEGELIAATGDTLHVLTTDSVLSLAMREVSSVTLTAYDARLAQLTLWSALGALSTASHGVGLILTFPLWVISGTAVTASASKAPRVQSTDPAALQPYARFPQGLPPEVNRQALRQKRVPRT